VGWAGALRRSEIVSIDHDDVGFGEQGVTIRLRQTKSSQDTVVSVDIPKAKNEAVCPVLALRAWLELSHITEGSVFRGMRKGDHLTDGRLSDRHVDGINTLDTACVLVGAPLPVAQERFWLTQCGIRDIRANALRSAISAQVAAGSTTPARTYSSDHPAESRQMATRPRL
jgi:hypothetical protein